MLQHLVFLWVATFQLSAFAAGPSVSREPLAARPVERASWAPRGWLVLRADVRQRQSVLGDDAMEEWGSRQQAEFGVARNLSISVEGDWLDQGSGWFAHQPGFGLTVGLLRSEPLSRSLAVKAMHHTPMADQGLVSDQTSLELIGDLQWGGLLLRAGVMGQHRWSAQVLSRVRLQGSAIGQAGPLMLVGDASASAMREATFGDASVRLGVQWNRALSTTVGPTWSFSSAASGRDPEVNPGDGSGVLVAVELAL